MNLNFPHHMSLPVDAWLSAARTRLPDQTIRDESGDPYLKRWFIVPKNEQQNIYLHHFLRDDKDVPHDHPWASVSIILDGGYIEEFPGNLRVIRAPGDLIHREAEQAHRVILNRDLFGAIIPAWSLFITGPKVRRWGFHCPHGWVYWRDFVAANDSGAVGLGCAG